jgi:gliding motility-associated-like protein
MTTIYTFPYIEENNCKYQIRVHWTNYAGWQTGVKDYDVYCSINDGPYSFLGNVPGNINNYIHTGILDTTSYSYYVKANSYNNKTSTSNSVRTFPDIPNLPEFINADYATVENSYIKLSYTLDDSSEVKNYRIMRSDSLNGNYLAVKTFNNWVFHNLEYKDNAVDVEKVYYYRLDAIDLCGNILFSSNTSKNIEINITNNNDFSPIITWDRYIDWLGGDIQYNIYRVINDDVTNIYSSFNAVNYYRDEISQEDISKITGQVCYMVEAIEGDSNPHGVKGFSRSAIKCLEQESYVLMPNAFTPNNDNINDIFKPLAIFISDEDYKFEIYNRWGEKIFGTNDILEGWTGKNKRNQVMSEGVYYYMLHYKDFYDDIHKLSGEVTLIF